ncbi:DUF1266 domain-containing protein [Microbacterium sp. Clip185]|uniref:DUF1266 domain-containing protein n=1 Tax=Microbacterium sp. Clip185 TaxID=3025663 RepID=UPI0023656ACB|nr:DUF1266 domain-containing protein [Microbacterium sp. Clip185]WDG17711.1 DUF1266 domain-containing protein [Microbacterium sp. Clip185]
MSAPVSVLQNHPGEVEFPVRTRWRYVRLMERRRRADPRQMRRRALPVTAIAVPFGIVAVVASVGSWAGGSPTSLFVMFFLGLMVGLLVASTALSFFDASAPLRAQRRYVGLAARTPLTERQQQILALDAASDFAIRGWNSSLAFTPTFAELPQQVRAKHQDGQRGAPWFALPLPPIAQLRASLDEQYKIVSGSDAELLVADTLSQGLLSSRFAEIANSDDAERMMSRVASLTGLPVFDVYDLARGSDEQPPRLLLAADIERAIGGVRYAYVADYLDAADAWRLLEQLAAKAFAVYRSPDEYWREVVIATAFRSDSLEAVQRQRAAIAELGSSAWPAASVTWPAA